MECGNTSEGCVTGILGGAPYWPIRAQSWDQTMTLRKGVVRDNSPLLPPPPPLHPTKANIAWISSGHVCACAWLLGRAEFKHCFWTQSITLDIILHPLSLCFVITNIAFQYLLSNGQYFILWFFNETILLEVGGMRKQINRNSNKLK